MLDVIAVCVFQLGSVQLHIQHGYVFYALFVSLLSLYEVVYAACCCSQECGLSRRRQLSSDGLQSDPLWHLTLY